MKACILLSALLLIGCGQKEQSDEPTSPGPKPSETKPAIAKPTNAKIIATVLDQQITEDDHKQLQGLIFGRLFEKFAKDNKIEPTEEEIETFNVWMDKSQRESTVDFKNQRAKLVKELESNTLSDDERNRKKEQLDTIENILKVQREMDDAELKASEQEKKEIQQGSRRVAQRFIRRWKTNKAFFEKYGGRVLFQQAGSEPIDAYRDYLKEMEEKGVWKIFDKKYEDEFWKYFLEQPEYFLSSAEESKETFKTPLWEMELGSTEE